MSRRSSLQRQIQRGTKRTLAKVASIQEVIEEEVRAHLTQVVCPVVIAMREAIDSRDFTRVSQLVGTLENIFSPLLTPQEKPA